MTAPAPRRCGRKRVRLSAQSDAMWNNSNIDDNTRSGLQYNDLHCRGVAHRQFEVRETVFLELDAVVQNVVQQCPVMRKKK
jgi:hypothetical protein